MKSKKLNKKLQKTLVLFSRILGIIVILSVVLLLIPLTLPRLMGYETYNVVSGSMEPEIPVGSLLLVKSVDPYEIEEDDIITFYSNGTVVSHRVVRNNSFEKTFTTKGDANDKADLSDITYNQVIGVMKYHIPRMGQVLMILDTGMGKMLMICLAACGALLVIIGNRLDT